MFSRTRGTPPAKRQGLAGDLNTELKSPATKENLEATSNSVVRQEEAYLLKQG